MKSLLVFTSLFFTVLNLNSQDLTISGTIIDHQSGEQLLGANIYDTLTLAGTSSNYYGFFSLKLPAGKHNILFSYVGYQAKLISINLQKDTLINLSLSNTDDIKEVVIRGTSPQQTVESTQMSRIDLPITQIKNLPVMLGEVDILKTIQLLPGVQSGSEGMSGLYVRGGGPDQNLILLDGVPVYNASHLFGFFSVFNADAIQNVSLIKGGFPARYGGRLSSILDIKMKEGNMKELKGYGSIGLISSKFTLEGPIIKNKASFIVSGRRTYIDLLSLPIQAAINRNFNDGTEVFAGYFFHDLNSKINYIINDKNRIYLSFYSGKDKAYAREKFKSGDYSSKYKFDFGWGNITSSLRWNHIIGNKIFSNTMLTYTRYNMSVSNDFSGEDFSSGTKEVKSYFYEYFSGIIDYGIKTEFDYAIASNHALKFGLSNTVHTYNPGVNAVKYLDDFLEENSDTTFGNKDIVANEFVAYIEDDWIISKKIKANIGLHHVNFHVGDQWYNSLQPRMSLRYLIRENLSAKTSYTEMVQNIHLLTNSSVSLPTDLWLPVTNNIKPMRSKQYAAGLAYNLLNKMTMTLEGYYKTMDNVIEYEPGAQYFNSQEGWEAQIITGNGYAYGVEILLQKTIGKTQGWIGYTWSKTEREFQEIRNGDPFPYKYDRRHDLSISVTQKLNDRISLGATWIYGSGYPFTFANEIYSNPILQQVGLYYYEESFDSDFLEYNENRNNYRMPDYHRLDLGITLTKQKRRYTRSWSFGLYNAYNRRNAFLIYKDGINGSKDNGKVLKQLTLFPVIPYVNYSFKF